MKIIFTIKLIVFIFVPMCLPQPIIISNIVAVTNIKNSIYRSIKIRYWSIYKGKDIAGLLFSI